MNLLNITSGTWTVTFIGWGLVFLALVIMVLIFSATPKIHTFFTELKLRKQGKLKADETLSDTTSVTGEENAAIAMALYMFLNEQHDEESGVITIKAIEKRYSPWSSKIYGLNNQGF